MPTAYGYARQSSDAQLENGIPNQHHHTRNYYEGLLKPKGVENFVFLPDDSAISARTNPFMLRHAGKALMQLLQPGDHFIIDKIDRLWRSSEDFVDVMRMFKQRGVTLHICNLMGANIQLGTPMGDFFMNVMVSIAQLESDQVSDRMKRAFQSKRLAGRYAGGRGAAPLGCRVVGELIRDPTLLRTTTNTRTLQWDETYRALMGELVRLADEDQMTAFQIYHNQRKHLIEFVGKDFWKALTAKKHMGPMMICKHYWREKQYRVLPHFDPNRIRFGIFGQQTVKWRDIGPNEPKTPNPFPFLDGRPIPTLEEFYKMAG